MQIIPYLFVFFIGINIGSFLNVCIYRLPLGKTIVRGRSYCPRCDSLIAWYYNIPLISYILLRGKCGYCRAPISPIYPFVELLNGLLYSLIFITQGFTFSALLMSLLVSLLLIVSFIDAKYQLIPDGLVISILVLAIVNMIYMKAYVSAPLLPYLMGFFAASLPLLLLGIVYEDGLGGGDIKLMAAAGIFTGWKLILLGLFLGNLMALVYVGWLYLQGKAGRGTAIAFGPFLSSGIICVLLFGERLLSLYITLVF